MNKELYAFELKKQDTLVLKGIAIIAMLCHHVYGSETDSSFLIWLSVLGKVCVAIFVFCSGYGLSVSYPKSIQRDNLKTIVKGSIRFEIKRLIKFYSNYWVVFLIFVPISVFCFGRSLSMAYGNDSNILFSLVLDLFGFQGLGSFNMTWWFNKLILLFYFCFPILWWACRKGPIVTLFFSLVACLQHYKLAGYGSYFFLYSLPFVLGIFWSQYHMKFARRNLGIIILSLAFFIGFVSIRMNGIIPKVAGYQLDGLLTCALALLIICLRPLLTKTFSALAFLGKHSANIYLLHTFWNVYWPTSVFIHNVVSGGVKLVVLFAISLLSSIVIEWIKKQSRYNVVIDKVIAKV